MPTSICAAALVCIFFSQQSAVIIIIIITSRTFPSSLFIFALLHGVTFASAWCHRKTQVSIHKTGSNRLTALYCFFFSPNKGCFDSPNSAWPWMCVFIQKSYYKNRLPLLCTPPQCARLSSSGLILHTEPEYTAAQHSTVPQQYSINNNGGFTSQDFTSLIAHSRSSLLE